MRFFDACVSYGPVMTPVLDVDYSLDSLLCRMEEYHIDKALTYHSTAREYDAPTGNARLMEEIRGNDRLLPVWALLPHHTGEMEEPDLLMEKMLLQGVRAAIMFPGAGRHNFSMKKWSVGPLMKGLCEHRIPLLLGIDQMGGMERMAEFAMEYPENPIIALNMNYRYDRILFAAMGQTDNLYMETSGFKSFFGIQEFVSRFGAERLVFGSGMPDMDPAASVSLITWSGLEKDQQALIAHGNLERLIGEVR